MKENIKPGEDLLNIVVRKSAWQPGEVPNKIPWIARGSHSPQLHIFYITKP
jgi:hypothetical protein